MTPASASAKVDPTVGWPAIGISRPGVKIRIRMSVSGRSAGRMKVDSEKFISFVTACIVSAGEAARIEEDGQLVAAELLAP